MEKNKKQRQEEDNKEEQSSDYFLGSKMLGIITGEASKKLDIYKPILDLAIELARKIGEEELPTKRPLAVVAACIYFSGIATGHYWSEAYLAKIYNTSLDTIKKVLQMPFFKKIAPSMGCRYTKSGWKGSRFSKPITFRNARFRVNKNASELLKILKDESKN